MTESEPTLADRRGEEFEVYGPAEDSALLAGVVSSDRDVHPQASVLDVGTGSGYVGAKLADATGATIVGIDLNPAACRRARERGLAVVIGNLVAPFRDNSFDIVVFNPPYLPTVAGAAWDDWFEVAVTGGETGRAVIARFLDSVARVLTPAGVVYLLVSSFTGVEAVAGHAGERGFSVVAVADAPFAGETLTVLKLLQ